MAFKLLLADDSITIQKVVELVLAEEGFEIKAANNGEEALQQLPGFNPDIVLADIEMPRVNGYQLCEKIKSNPATAGIPVLLLAGAFEPVDEELVRKVGAADFIVKPFESQDLIAKLNAALSVGAAVAEAVPEEVFAAEEVAQVVEAGEAAAPADDDLWAMEDFSAGTTPLAEETPESVEEAAFIGEASEDAEPLAADAFAMPEAFEKTPAPSEPPVIEKFAAPSGPAVRESISVPQVSAAEVSAALRDASAKSISEAVKAVDVKGLVQSAVLSEIRGLIEKTVRESAPQIINTVVREVSGQIAQAVRQDVEKIIWETVPDLAENMIRKEIEALKAEI